MNVWRKWLGLHPVQRWALRVAALVVFLHVVPIQPYVPACAEAASIFNPPRLRPEALAEASSAMSNTWWRHVVTGGIIWMVPFQTRDLNSDWENWQINVEHLITRRIAEGVKRNGQRLEPPAALLQALDARRSVARERRTDDDPFWHEGMEYRDCVVQRAAFLPG